MFGLVEALLLPLLRAWFHWHVEGAENIPKAGPAIVACNHVSYLDPLAIGYVVEGAGRRPRFLAKSELFADRRLGWLLRATGQIEVSRGTTRAALALERAHAALRAGEVVVIFPEGTVTTDPDLRPMAARTGAVRLALTSQASVIPCALWGTANVWPKGSYRKSWGPRQDILVRVGAPMRLEGDANSREQCRAAGQTLMEEIARLGAGLRPVVPDRRRPLGKTA
jgi:1-acyl-sn-glycerol-3-phosphate acyltransferase